jgi:cytidine deaminase
MEESKPDYWFHQFLEAFPLSVREYLQTMQKTGGMLSAENCQVVMESLNISVETLMQRLLPMAKLYCATTISGFQVGAVAKARMSDNDSEIALFLGANIEFLQQALTQTIHAEQSAVINAWLQGARQISGIAVTAAPCGYCRQFLYELEGSQNLKVILHNQIRGKTTQHNLSDFLPEAFGPHELGSATGLMAAPAQHVDLHLKSSSNDPFVLEARAAAKKSYAPYSKNFAGCVIKTVAGKMYIGRYAENAAFNPSLSALHTAIIRMRLDQPGSENIIIRAVLVERPSSISQRAVCELLLQTVAPNVNLEYFEAVLSTN